MRGLIGVYLILAFVHLTFATGTAISGFLASALDDLLLSALIAASACPPLLVALGLWRRWRVVRYVLIGISWWMLFGSILMTSAALTTLITGRHMGIHDPPMQTLAIAGSMSVFAGLQWWILARPAVRRSFQRTPEKVYPIDECDVSQSPELDD